MSVLAAKLQDESSLCLWRFRFVLLDLFLLISRFYDLELCSKTLISGEALFHLRHLLQVGLCAQAPLPHRLLTAQQ